MHDTLTKKPTLIALSDPYKAGKDAYCEGESNPFPKEIPQHYEWEIGYCQAWRDDPLCEHFNDYIDQSQGSKFDAEIMAEAQFEMDLYDLKQKRNYLAKKLQDIAPDIEEIAKVINFPVEYWPGNCHGIATAMVEHNLPTGYENIRVVRGHWTGPVDSKSIFYQKSKKTVVPHSWISLGNNIICDPTRFAFENKDPYIFIGSTYQYDVAGQKLRKAMQQNNPFPQARKEEKTYLLRFSNSAWPFMQELTKLDQPQFTQNQIFWLANQPHEHLDEHAASIYETLKNAGYKAFIPMDSWNEVFQQ